MTKRKILVFAHVPPPHHGQSVMVEIMLEGLRADPRFEVHHVDARVSDDLEDVGSFRPLKFVRLLQCIMQAWWIRLRHGRMAFYYVPAPAKRSAIVRDWVVMALCRPLFPELILHWHAYGLGEWVAAGNDWARKLTRWALGGADLSIVLNEYNKRDAEVFAPKWIEVVPNGIKDLFPDYETALAPKRKDRAAALKALHAVTGNEWRVAGGEGGMGGGGSVFRCFGDSEGAVDRANQVAGNESRVTSGKDIEIELVRFLFLGHLIESKGVFVAIEATRLANEELAKSGAAWRAHLTLAGSFASEEEKGRVLAAVHAANRISHSRRRSRRQPLGKLKKMEEDRSTRLADARTGGNALSRVTPAQGGFVQEELGEGVGSGERRAETGVGDHAEGAEGGLGAGGGDSHGDTEARRFLGEDEKGKDGEGGMGAGGSVFRWFGGSGAAGEKAHEVTSDEWRVASGPSSEERLRVGERPEAGGPSGAMIELVGFLDAGQKKSALEEADCLVFPTFYEGETQGLVLLEAMSAGLPVITTSWRGVPEVLPEGYALIVTPGSDQELAAAMIAAVGNNWNAALRQRYVEHYTISEHVELLVRKLSGVSGGVD